ncbi:MAG: AMP-binding protein, partial [Pseudomonadota bacterium]
MTNQETGNPSTTLNQVADLSPRDGLSHVMGPKKPKLADVTIPELLRQTVALFPDHMAVVSAHQGIRRNYAALDKDVTEFAAGLLALGLKQGDRVGIWAPNCYEWILTQLATAQIGLRDRTLG